MYEYGIDVFSKDLVNVIEVGLIEPPSGQRTGPENLH
jgi:hypothetical protein